METMTKSVEQVVREIKTGVPFNHQSPVDPEKTWKIKWSELDRVFVLSHNKSKRTRILSERATSRIIHNCINE